MFSQQTYFLLCKNHSKVIRVFSSLGDKWEMKLNVFFMMNVVWFDKYDSQDQYELGCHAFSVHRITPYEWDNPHPCKGDPEELESQWSFKNAMWFGIASFLCQGSDILPK